MASDCAAFVNGIGARRGDRIDQKRKDLATSVFKHSNLDSGEYFGTAERPYQTLQNGFTLLLRCCLTGRGLHNELRYSRWYFESRWEVLTLLSIHNTLFKPHSCWNIRHRRAHLELSYSKDTTAREAVSPWTALAFSNGIPDTFIQNSMWWEKETTKVSIGSH